MAFLCAQSIGPCRNIPRQSLRHKQVSASGFPRHPLSASAGVNICLANLAQDQKLFSHFLGQKLTRYEDKCQYKSTVL